MTPAHHAVPESVAIEPQVSLDASDDFELPSSTQYCPTELLGTFTLLMAGHGRCVSAAMMLGDREYAIWQLARAQTLSDPTLRQAAVGLFAYFGEQHARLT
jgi:hypothetical protein